MKLNFALTITAFAISAFVAASCTIAANSAQTVAKTDEPKNVSSQKRMPVIVELFTSEGCSSCPPADKTLEFIEREQPFANVEIIALSEHVDYWNRLGWADPFSSAQFSERQSEYSRFFGKNNDVYTPQMIVDGTREFVGSNMRAAQKAIEDAGKIEKADVRLNARIEKDTVLLDIKIENLPEKLDSAIVLLAVTEDKLFSNITRGENTGQKLGHTAVARSLTNVGTINGSRKSVELAPIFKLDKSWKNENLNAVVFVQKLKSRQILGARKISLRETDKK